MGAPATFAWSTNYLIERTETRFGLKPRRLIGDTAYGGAKMLGWMVEEKAIEPHVSLGEKGERDDGTFRRSDITFDPVSNSYSCPGGTLLK